MNKATCKISYRGYIPYGWIAFKFCHVDFYGKNSDEYSKEWHNIEYSNVRKYEGILDKKKNELKKLEAELEKEKNGRNKLVYIPALLTISLPILLFFSYIHIVIENQENKWLAITIIPAAALFIFLIFISAILAETIIESKKQLELEKDIEILSEEIEELNNKKYFSPSELLYKAENMLKQNGFVLTNEYSDGHRVETTTSIYEKQGD